MYILTIHYPKSEGASFDFGYFQSTHLPAVGKAFQPFGLGYASVLRGEEAIGGGEPAYFATTILSFSDEEAARNAVASDAAKAPGRGYCEIHQRDAGVAVQHAGALDQPVSGNDEGQA